MLSKKHFFLTLIFLMLATVSVSVFAQDESGGEAESPQSEEPAAEEPADAEADGDNDSDDYPYPAFRSEEYKEFVPKGRHDQQDKFLDRTYAYPAKPKDKWEVGLTLGYLAVSGDVKSYFRLGNFGVGGHVRKSLGYLFSIRGNFMMGSTAGKNWEPANGWSVSSLEDGHIPNTALAGGARYDDFNDDFETPDYRIRDAQGRVLGGRYIFYNYKTNIRELTMSGILTLHNIRFHKRQTKMELYGLAGIGGLAYRTFTDQLDDNGNEYDYRPVLDIAAIDINVRGDVFDALDNLRDGTYESQAERHFDDSGFGFLGDYTYQPTAHVGVGLAFKLNRLINLALETRVTYTQDDLLDGQRWQEWGALTRDYDTYVYTSLGVNFNLGAKNSVEPLWWMNPLDYAYQELAEAPCCDELPPFPDLEDDDNDGVPNAWDEEPDSREGCPVDTKGRMIDSDRDGVLDCDDKEPHTRYDAIDQVDEFGIAPPIKIKCDQIDDFCNCVKPCIPNRPDTVIVEKRTETVREIVKEVRVEVPVIREVVQAPPPPPPPPPPAPDPCANVVLPRILFDLNKYSVKPEFQPQLAEVARILRDCSNMTLCVVGHTDVRSSNGYNDALSYKRAEEVVNLLVTQYGVPRSRLVIQYRGEIDPAIQGLSDSPIQKAIDADHALNRRVEFQVCPPDAINMGRPAGYKNAGSRKPKP